MQGVKLLGLIENWAEISPWVRFLYHALRLSVNNALKVSRSIVVSSSEITHMIKAVATAPDTNDAALQDLYLKKKIAKDMYHSKVRVFINKTMQVELSLLTAILQHPSEYSLSSPIAHLVARQPDYQSFGDASLDAGGGFSDNPRFWWHIQFPTWVRQLTLRHLQILVKSKAENKLITINVLEFLVEIINYAAMTTYVRSNPDTIPHPYPVLLNWTDNMSALAWIRKASLKSLMAKGLQRVLCTLMINNPLGLSSSHIAGVDNTTADAISRTFTGSNIPPSSDTLLQAVPKLKSYMRFHPSAELLSHLYSALSLTQKRGLPQISKLGHFSPGNNTL